MEKKKGSLITTSFFLQSKLKTVPVADNKSSQTVSESKAENHSKKTVEESIKVKNSEIEQSTPEPAPPSATEYKAPVISIKPKYWKQFSSLSLASIRKMK